MNIIKSGVSLTNQLLSSLAGELVRNSELIEILGSFYAARPAHKYFGNSNAILAIGANLLIGTVTANKYPILSLLVASSSIAGILRLNHSGTTIAEIPVAAGIPIVLPFGSPYGLLSTIAQGGTINISNQTGAISNVVGSLVWTEYPL